MKEKKKKKQSPTLSANLEKKKNVKWRGGQLITSGNVCLWGSVSLKPAKYVSGMNAI